jgi:hypothetical protein
MAGGKAGSLRRRKCGAPAADESAHRRVEADQLDAWIFATMSFSFGSVMNLS